MQSRLTIHLYLGMLLGIANYVAFPVLGQGLVGSPWGEHLTDSWIERKEREISKMEENNCKYLRSLEDLALAYTVKHDKIKLAPATWKRAIKLRECSSDQCPNFIDLAWDYYYLANTLAELNNYSEAITTYKTALILYRIARYKIPQYSIVVFPRGENLWDEQQTFSSRDGHLWNEQLVLGNLVRCYADAGSISDARKALQDLERLNEKALGTKMDVAELTQYIDRKEARSK